MYYAVSSIISEMDNHPITGQSSTVARYKENKNANKVLAYWSVFYPLDSSTAVSEVHLGLNVE